MTTKKLCVLTLIGVFGAFCTHPHLNADPPAKQELPDPADKHRVSLAVARDRAELMHELFSETLDVVHHRYFRRDGAVLPARAMEDVFTRLEKRSNVKARWIAVNTPAMSVNHEPETAFEKKAAEELEAGKAAYSLVEKGYYLEARPIPLGAGCIGCHTKLSPITDKKPRLAALVIAIPVKEK